MNLDEPFNPSLDAMFYIYHIKKIFKKLLSIKYWSSS